LNFDYSFKKPTYSPLIEFGFISENHLQHYFIFDYFIKGIYTTKNSRQIVALSPNNEIQLSYRKAHLEINTGINIYFGKMKKLKVNLE